MYEDEEHLDEAEEDLTTEKISKPPDISTWGKSSDSEEMTAWRKEWEDSIKDFTRIRRAQTSTRNNPGKFRPELSPIGWNKKFKEDSSRGDPKWPPGVGHFDAPHANHGRPSEMEGKSTQDDQATRRYQFG